MAMEENSVFSQMEPASLDSGKKAKQTESLRSTTQMDMQSDKVFLVGMIVLKTLK